MNLTKKIMIVKQAEFVISNTDPHKCPQDGRPEYAFIGRSNVGKSSLINMLTGRKGLAMTSSTPGKTQLINHFLINDEWYLVDLPGYGYAQRGKKGREQIQSIIDSYLEKREELPPIFCTSSEHKKGKEELLAYIEGINRTL
jgi:GTP-binding protein